MNTSFIDVLDCRNDYLANSKVWFYHVDHNEVLGTVSVEVLGENWGWINDLFVAPAVRRNGFATKLVSRAVTWCKEAGLLGCSAGIHPENSASLAVFSRGGFVHSYTWPERESLMYSKPFPGAGK